MIKKFTENFINNVVNYDDSYTYKELLKRILVSHSDIDEDSIIQIGGNDYEGTLIFIFSDVYNNRYWYTKVYYGSCIACDALEAAIGNPEDIKSLMLHLVQSIKECE